MEYIFIMLLAILITTILVFVLANSVLGIHLRWKTLALCAACSMVISLVLPHVVVGVAGLAGSMAVLAMFAVAFAYFVAKYDAYDERKLAAEQAEPLVEQLLVDAADEYDAVCSQMAADNEAIIALAEIEDQSNACLPEELVIVPEVSEVYALAEVVPAADTHEQDISDAKEEITVADEAIMETEATEFAMGEQKDIENVITEKTVDDTAMVGEQEVRIETIDEIQTLDDLMDYAFAQKEGKNFGQALAAFRKAFDLYGNSESAPFIVIEMGNILKNKGAYDDAIQIFTEGRNLPVLQYDHILEQEFVSTIAYLRIVKNILLAQRLGFIPYNDIPGAVFAEINAEFGEWRNLA